MSISDPRDWRLLVKVTLSVLAVGTVLWLLTNVVPREPGFCEVEVPLDTGDVSGSGDGPCSFVDVGA